MTRQEAELYLHDNWSITVGCEADAGKVVRAAEALRELDIFEPRVHVADWAHKPEVAK